MADLFVHVPPLTPIEARVLYGVLASWCNSRDTADPAWGIVNSLRTAVGESRNAHDVIRAAERLAFEAQVPPEI